MYGGGGSLDELVVVYASVYLFVFILGGRRKRTIRGVEGQRDGVSGRGAEKKRAGGKTSAESISLSPLNLKWRKKGKEEK